MTKEEKDLLLMDLCARLPYKFIIHRYCDNVNITIDDIDDFAHFLEYSEGEDFKPYLRPMSSMTEKEKEEIESISKRWIESHGIFIWPNEGNCVLRWNTIETVLNWLDTHHFDYRGLIEKGLAIEAPEGMYNI